MWRYLKWGFWTVLILIVGGFLHYTLPQRDIVRVTGTYNRLTEIGANSMFYASPDSGTTEDDMADEAPLIRASNHQHPHKSYIPLLRQWHRS